MSNTGRLVAEFLKIEGRYAIPELLDLAGRRSSGVESANFKPGANVW
ncbi:hypothetical protein [Actinokineospora sp. NBRC 105648]|nr:hypothetical protein [Actinokineospora sp. NBRC 105648]GLZ38605.1 hypothetical protein Acsp05_22290 [Actinokineospora sp. NBRC 105648]